MGGGGFLNVTFLEAMYENNPEFPRGRGRGFKEKHLLWGEYGYFL